MCCSFTSGLTLTPFQAPAADSSPIAVNSRFARSTKVGSSGGKKFWQIMHTYAIAIRANATKVVRASVQH
jgi:hypothetical protein